MNAKLLKKLPDILTVVSTVGVVAVAALAGHNTLKAVRVLEENDYHPEEDQTKKEVMKDVVKLTWKCYIPTVTVSAVTVASIIANQKLNKKQIATLVATMGAGSKFFKEYQDVIKEKFGIDFEEDIHREIARRHEDGIPVAVDPKIETMGMISSTIDPYEEGDTLFYDEIHNQWFRSSLYAVKNATYHLNRNAMIGGDATLAAFYTFLGLDPLEGFETVGWGEDFFYAGYCWIDIHLIPSEKLDGEKYYILRYEVEPDILQECFY